MNSNRWLPDQSRLRQPAAGTQRRAALFLDRDGVLVEDVHFLRHVDRIHVIEHSICPLQALQQHYLLVVTTNQSGIARGLFDVATFEHIDRRVVDCLARRGVTIDCVYYCPHHPEAVVAAYKKVCGCRKPAPGMLLRAAADWDIDLSDSYMVGDRAGDLEAGRAAGVGSLLLDSAHPAGTWTTLLRTLATVTERTEPPTP